MRNPNSQIVLPIGVFDIHGLALHRFMDCSKWPFSKAASSEEGEAYRGRYVEEPFEQGERRWWTFSTVQFSNLPALHRSCLTPRYPADTFLSGADDAQANQ